VPFVPKDDSKLATIGTKMSVSIRGDDRDGKFNTYVPTTWNFFPTVTIFHFTAPN